MPPALPPGPRRKLSLANLLAFRRDPPGFLLDLAHEYGDVVHFRIGPQHVFLLSRPDQIQDVLEARQRHFAKGGTFQRAQRMVGQGLLTSEGEFHRRQRRLVQPAFHRKRVDAYAELMTRWAVRTCADWKEGAEVDVAREMARLTLGVVGESLFGTDLDRDAEEIGIALSRIMEPPARNPLKAALDWMRTALPHVPRRAGQDGRPEAETDGGGGGRLDGMLAASSELLERLPSPRRRRFDRARARLDATMYRVIEARRASGEDRGDVLSMLLAARDEDGEGGMTDLQVRDEAMTLLLAGHETMANAMAWTWYLLSENPLAEGRLHEEVDGVLGGRLPGIEDVPRLPYVRAVFAEAMRLYPPVWVIGRRPLAETEVAGYAAPAGSLVLASEWVVHHDARWWPDPWRFEPGRWLAPDADDRPKFAYFPFGGGARLCIGESFAWLEGVLLIATLAQRWRMRLVAGHPIALLPLITLRPKHGIRMTLERRHEPAAEGERRGVDGGAVEEARA